MFQCPADDFNCDEQPIKDLFPFDQIGGKGFYCQPVTHYMSYFFNGRAPGAAMGTRMAQKHFSSVNEPAKLIACGEISGGAGMSAHDRKEPYQFANACDMMSFVDGHVAYIRMYWNGVKGLAGIPFFYEPPAGYDYKWSLD